MSPHTNNIHTSGLEASWTAEDKERTDTVLAEILQERRRQNSKWGRQDHGREKWLAILGEEFGEVCQAVLKQKESDVKAYRDELIQVAAVAVAAIENLDRWSTCRCNEFQKYQKCQHVRGQ